MLKGQDVVAWIRNHVPSMRLSRAKTLGALVVGAMKMRGAGVLALGRAMEGTAAPKHRIKRAWRFLRNPDVEQLEVSAGIFRRFAPPQGRIIVLCDWTDLTPYQQLVLSLPRDGRSMPFLSLTIFKQAGSGAMVRTERKILAYLAGMAPKDRQLVLVADRGFGNSRWIGDVRKWGWSFVQRISGYLTVDLPEREYIGPVEEMGVKRGAAAKDWGQGTVTQEHAFSARVVSVWAQDAKEPWVLATDLVDIPTAEVIRLYKRRMWIEATFRDLKNRRWGLGLDSTRLSQPARHDRLFLVLAIAYALLCCFGAAAEASNVDRLLKANTVNERAMTLARIGFCYLQVYVASIESAVNAFMGLPV
jgi:hypothetical protein